MSRAATVAHIERDRIIAILRLKDPAIAVTVIEALVAGGLTLIEITMSVPNAIGLIADISRRLPSDVVVGAGTILDVDTASRAIDAGARFVVSPVCRSALVAACHKREVAMMPGCYSPTEILAASDAGADFVKLFPARSLAPSYIRDVREPLPHVKVIPTGGITADNAADWLRAGASAVGVGGALLDRAAVAAGRFEVLTAAAARLRSAVERAR
ncbi:MAG TPA: bifunctional 4-hydroxy-2-oxoglutarate aldolase/2-dehydro-3-deoxy-phosphogluconate aldolase [Vicinamibacterales bacterium]|nr:bifunctional 4-hydroxy-2-oxoglutarate aldolase/2-dehydro-3-deoxy-phosphogluconate aldolase [Vicinamibacterales bacterium]